MKKLIALIMVVFMAAACFAGCAAPAEEAPAAAAPAAEPAAAEPAAAADPAAAEPTGPIKVGMVGCYTGDYAVYGMAVKNGAQLYFDQINAAGGINGKQIEIIAYDNKGDNAEAVNAFTRMVDEGITALVGDVLTGNTIAVVGEAYPINMPMVTASATAEAVTFDVDSGTVYSNVFRTCFIDPFQGEKMADYAFNKLEAKSACVIFETGNDYAVGLADAFKAKFTALGGTILSEEGYAKGDVNFKSQLTNMSSKTPDVVFCPNYYQDDGMIVTQAREVGMSCAFLGGDGFAGIKDYGSAEDLEGCMFCSGYAPGSTEAVKKFEEEYKAAYGEDVPNMFAPLAYDAAKLICAAIAKAEETGEEPASDAYKQAVIDAVKEVGPTVEGVTSASGYTFDEHNNPIKEAVIMAVTGGVETFKEMY